jgi:hypothetical protein
LEASEVDRIVPWHWKFSRPDLPFVNTALPDQLEHGYRQLSANVGFAQRLQLAGLTPTQYSYFRPNALSSHPRCSAAFRSFRRYTHVITMHGLHRTMPQAELLQCAGKSRLSISSTLLHLVVALCSFRCPSLRLCEQGSILDFLSPTASAFVCLRRSLDGVPYIGSGPGPAEACARYRNRRADGGREAAGGHLPCLKSFFFAESLEISCTWRDMQWRSACSESPRSNPDAVSSHTRIYQIHSFRVLQLLPTVPLLGYWITGELSPFCYPLSLIWYL